MSFPAEVLFQAIGWPVVVGLLALVVLLSRPKPMGQQQDEPVAVAEPLPEPKVPRDTSRPYPRPKGSRSKLNRVCPVCGTGPETGDLNGRLLGWPAHASCAEWLGDWKPPGYEPPPPSGRASASIIQTGHSYRQKFPTARSPFAGAASVDGSFPVASGEDLGRAQEMVKNGLISVAEARERLNQEIIAAWGVPPAILGEHTHKVGDPLPIERCPECGAQFCGTPDYLRSAYKTHRQLGCR